MGIGQSSKGLTEKVVDRMKERLREVQPEARAECPENGSAERLSLGVRVSVARRITLGPQPAGAIGVGHRFGDFRFRQNHLGPVLLR